MHTIELLLWDLPRCSQLLQIAPVFKTHQGSWDKVGIAAANYSRLLPYSRLTRAAGTRYYWLQRSKLTAQAGSGPKRRQNCSLSGLNVNNCCEMFVFEG